MKAIKSSAILMTAFFLSISCGLPPDGNDDNDEPGETCDLNRTSYDYGDVMVGEMKSCLMTIKADNEEDPHITDTVTVECDDFFLYDNMLEETYDTLIYDLTYPESRDFTIIFAPSEPGPATCDVNLGDVCGTLSLTGDGVESGVWGDVESPTLADLFDMHFNQGGEGIACGDSGIILYKHVLDDHWTTPDHGYKYAVFGDTKLKTVWEDGLGNKYAAGGEIEAAAAEIFSFPIVGADTWEVFNSDNLMEYYSSIWGAADCDIFFCGANVMSTEGYNIKRYICEGWLEYVVDWGISNVSGVYGTSGSDVWAVLSQPNNNVYHFNGISWALARESWMTAHLNDIWIAPEGDIFIVGSGGAIYHHGGQAWIDETISGLEEIPFHSVHGTGAQNLWAVGSEATIYHYDGSGWSQQAAPEGVTENLYSVWAFGALDVWAVGAGGRIIHLR